MALVPVPINLRPRKAAPERIRSRPSPPLQPQRKEQWVCPGCGDFVHDISSHLESGDCPFAEDELAQSLLRRARKRADFHQVVVPLAEAVACDCCTEARHVCAAVVVVDACGHVLGTQCCGTLARSMRDDTDCCLSSCACPVFGCNAKLSIAELRSILPGSLIAALQERSLARFLSRPADLIPTAGPASADSGSEIVVACPKCEHTVQLALDGIDLSKASHDAAACFDTYRIRCRACDATFCAQCRTSPYHADLTCDAMARRRQVTYTCRFCGCDVDPASAEQFGHAAETPVPEDCCSSTECRALAANVCCGLIAECGHPCYAHPSDPCVRCMVVGCTAVKLKCSDHTSAEDLCGICFTDELRYSPCVVYPCGHAFHHGCVANRLRARWPGHRITFGYMGCPMCGADVRPGDGAISPALAELLEPHFTFRTRVEELVLMRAEREGLGAEDSAAKAAGKAGADLIDVGMRQLAFYECSKCARPYFGGYQRCEAAMADDNGDDAGDDREAADRNRHELVCGGCVEDSDRVRCPAHGTAFIEYKCKFCCNTATYFCWGRTHFCGDCHRRQDRGEYLTRKAISDLPACPAEAGGVCPLGTIHPPNGVAEFPLGCALCRERDQRPSMDESPDDDGAAQA